MQNFVQCKPIKFINTFFEKYAIYFFALAIITLNYSLAFDNVMWGDEAFSGVVIRDTDLHGIFERIYFWDSHPPLYYYWLRLLADIFGYSIPVYHFSALIPFTAGILMAVFIFRKKFGLIPTAFFITISGLSGVCAEYNLEIRMYALVFAELLICSYSAYRISENNARIYHWILLTSFGVLAAYTHYFGLVSGSILLFFTSLYYFVRNRGKTWLYGCITILSYILLYAPWLFVFFKQSSTVSSGWWLTEIAPLSVLTEILFFGKSMRMILIPLTIILSVLVFMTDSGILYLKTQEAKTYISFSFRKFSTANWSNDLRGIILYWSVIIATILATYIASWLISPLTVARYMYPLTPLVLFILMIGIKRLLVYGNVIWGRKDKGEEQDKNETLFTHIKNRRWTNVVIGIIAIVFVAILTIGLFEFKYYRSISKTQNVQTEFILNNIGEPTEDTVFTAMNVQHLSWTVLPYYFPDNAVYACMPDEVKEDADHIWTFLGNDISESTLNTMKTKGYLVDEYKTVLMCKYSCNVYHFYRE